MVHNPKNSGKIIIAWKVLISKIGKIMNLKKLVEALSVVDQQVLRDLLNANSQEGKEAKEKKEKEWLENEKPKLTKKINEFAKEVKSLTPETLEINLKLTLVAKPLIEQDVIEYVTSGRSCNFNYEVTGKASSLDGKRNRNIVFLNAQLDSFLDGACSEVLELFPQFKKEIAKLEEKSNEIAKNVSEKIREGFYL